MSDANIIPPHQEITEPPFMRWIYRIPVILVGCFLLFYLFFLIPGTENIYRTVTGKLSHDSGDGSDDVHMIDPDSIRNDVPGKAANQAFEVVTPHNQSVMRMDNLVRGAEKITIVCKRTGPWKSEPMLMIDDATTVWDLEPVEGVWTADVLFRPGTHSLLIGGNRVNICLVDTRETGYKILNDPIIPSNWSPSYVHLGTNKSRECLDCHKIPNDTRTASDDFYSAKRVDCFSCHTKLGFEQTHFGHSIGIYENCTDCHSLHGATHKRLLNASLSNICSGCHEEPRL